MGHCRPPQLGAGWDFHRFSFFSSSFLLSLSTRGRLRREKAELLGCRWDGDTAGLLRKTRTEEKQGKGEKKGNEGGSRRRRDFVGRSEGAREQD